MRIIAGRFKSRMLKAPEGSDTRPTLSRTKESLFSILFDACEGARVLDLFAGSGALGLAALSRGARSVVYSANASAAIRVLKENTASLKVEKEVSIVKADWRHALASLHADAAEFDLIFIDPPYRAAIIPIMKMLDDMQLLSKSGIIIVEHAADIEVLPTSRYVVSDIRRYRDTSLTFFRRDDDHESGDISGVL